MEYCITAEEKRKMRILMDAAHRGRFPIPGAHDALNEYADLMERKNRRRIWDAMIAEGNSGRRIVCTNPSCDNVLPPGHEPQLCDSCRAKRARQRAARAQRDTNQTLHQVASFDALFDEVEE